MIAKSNGSKARLTHIIKNLGPGLVTGASDDDPSGIVTYSQAGAQFGFATLWTAWLTFPLMFSLQETCARIGMATSKGLITNIKKNFHPAIVFLTLLICIPALILNIAADLAAMGAVSHLIIPVISSNFFCVLYATIILLILIFCSYQKVVSILKYFCLSLLVYLIVPFTVTQDWSSVLKHAVIPHLSFDKKYLNILVALLGTTISPYLFFWQTTMEAEDVRQKKKSNDLISKMRLDVGVGMFISNIIMFFIILTAGSILFKNGFTNIDTVEEAAKALKPFAGSASYLIFSIGVIGTGLLAIPVFSSCMAYSLSSTFNLKEGLNKKYYQAKLFYLIIIASLFISLGLDLWGISPIKALIFTAVLYGISAPPLIFIVMLISNNKKIMGKYVNGKLSNIFNSITFLIMSLAAGLLIWFTLSDFFKF